MKSLLIMIGTVALALPAMAIDRPLTCRSTDENLSQGYEARISSNHAELYYQGRKIAELELKNSKSSHGSDRVYYRYYNQNTVNGFQITLRSGGFSGKRMATVLRGGVAGFRPIAQLNDCR